MAAEKKPSLALLIGSSKKESEEEETPMGNDEDEEGYAAAIGELFDAVKNDDREGFAEAFKAAVMSCK